MGYAALTSIYNSLDNTKKHNIIFNDLICTVEAMLVEIVAVENLSFKIK